MTALSAKPGQCIQQQVVPRKGPKTPGLTFRALAPRLLLEASACSAFMLDSLLATPFLQEAMHLLVCIACLWSILQV